jgi:4-hydroxybutyrate CoA-transferase
MNWLDQYHSKLCSADEAVRVVHSGDRVYIHPGCGTPEPLVEALARRAPELEDVEVTHMLTLGSAAYARPGLERSFRHNGMFLGGNVRQAVGEGRADYIPIFLSEIEGLFRSGEMPVDTVLLQTSPPDPYGYLSLGASIDCTLTAAQCARHVVAEVNSRMPRTLGDTFLHVSEVTSIVETSRQVLELRCPPPDEIQNRIAANVASLIEDGSVMQIGIGEIPEGVLACLKNHKDLGIHSEMVSDGVIELIERGVINGRRKKVHPGKILIGFVLGTQRILDFVHENPVFEFRRTEYVNDPYLIAQNDRMVAINSAIEVDLTGQVCSDSIGTKPYSGVGGQVDFVRGAARSRGGKPIIALPSTTKNGTVSRIVPCLKPGAGVVTSRADVHYVVTEFGVAYLHGKNLRQRAEALIAIAHPKFRDELAEAAARENYIHPDQVLVG